MAFIVCTGSEANEIALRMARQHTGKEMICTNFTYHGNTAAVDEGFARTGKNMWGYQVGGVTPDIVTMGNGHPLAGAVAKAELVNEFRDHVMYFNTFGGNPVRWAWPFWM